MGNSMQSSLCVQELPHCSTAEQRQKTLYNNEFDRRLGKDSTYLCYCQQQYQLGGPGFLNEAVTGAGENSSNTAVFICYNWIIDYVLTQVRERDKTR